MLMKSFYMILLLNFWYRFTLEHYIPPPNFCIFAQTCNHTWTSLCGYEANLKHNRMFLDQCDMFEYNCDYQKAYFQTEIDRCSKEIAETLPTSKQTTSTAQTTMSTSTTTIMTTSQPPFEVTTEGLTNLTDPTTQTEITTPSTISETKTTQAITTTLRTVPTKATTEELTKLPTTEANNVSNETKPILTSCTARPTTVPPNCIYVNFSSSTLTTKEITSPSTSTTSPALSTSTQKDITFVTTTITTTHKQNSTSVIFCDMYPEHCDRPRTWETTVKGETRDFFQILKARFGSRYKILEDTTHWPRRGTPRLNDIVDGLNFGHHNDGKELIKQLDY